MDQIILKKGYLCKTRKGNFVNIVGANDILNETTTQIHRKFLGDNHVVYSVSGAVAPQDQTDLDIVSIAATPHDEVAEGFYFYWLTSTHKSVCYVGPLEQNGRQMVHILGREGRLILSGPGVTKKQHDTVFFAGRLIKKIEEPVAIPTIQDADLVEL